MDLALAVALNLVLWAFAYGLLANRSPAALCVGLVAVSTIGAATFTAAFSLPEVNFLLVEAGPLALTTIVLLRALIREGGWTRLSETHREFVAVTERLPFKPSLVERVDIMAVVRPRTVQRQIWLFGVFLVWGLVRLVWAAVDARWSAAALATLAIVVTGAMLWLSVRAKRRAPATQRWLDEASR
jgi:hypothetical protein